MVVPFNATQPRTTDMISTLKTLAVLAGFVMPLAVMLHVAV